LRILTQSGPSRCFLEVIHFHLADALSAMMIFVQRCSRFSRSHETARVHHVPRRYGRRPRRVSIPAMIMLLIAASFAALLVLWFAAMLVLGPAGLPPMLASANSPLDKVDFSDLPAIEAIPARKGGAIAFRRWGMAASAADPILILIHGSALSSTSLHTLGKALAAAGIAVYAPD